MIVAVMASIAVLMPPPVHGDFDHDGRPDVAEVVSTRSGEYQLIVRHGDEARPVSVVMNLTAKQLANFYVTKAKPGRWKTWCGKGGGSNKDPCPRTHVTLTGDTLDFGTEEASQAVALWTGKAFEVVFLSD